VLFAGKPSLSRFLVLVRCAHDASVMLFRARDKETHSLGKRLPDLLACAGYVVVPIHERTLGVVAPRPNVQFEERR